MPSSTVHCSSDPDDFREAIRPAQLDYLVTDRGIFRATVVKINLHQLWMQKIVESLSRRWQVETHRTGLFFEIGPAENIGGDLISQEVGLASQGKSFWHGTSGPSRIGSLSLATDDLIQLGESLMGQKLHLSPDIRSFHPNSTALSRLARLHGAAVFLAETAPEVIANDDAARGFEASLTEVFIDCVTDGQARVEGAAWRRHASIVRRFEKLAQERSGEPLYLAEVCQALGVPRRTLDLCCREQFGISPKRYLILRRLQLAHAALRRSKPGGTSVTEIATRFGFWELGRFAVAYRSTFGESPSATLRAAPERRVVADVQVRPAVFA